MRLGPNRWPKPRESLSICGGAAWLLPQIEPGVPLARASLCTVSPERAGQEGERLGSDQRTMRRRTPHALAKGRPLYWKGARSEEALVQLLLSARVINRNYSLVNFAGGLERHALGGQWLRRSARECPFVLFARIASF